MRIPSSCSWYGAWHRSGICRWLGAPACMRCPVVARLLASSGALGLARGRSLRVRCGGPLACRASMHRMDRLSRPRCAPRAWSSWGVPDSLQGAHGRLAPSRRASVSLLGAWASGHTSSRSCGRLLGGALCVRWRMALAGAAPYREQAICCAGSCLGVGAHRVSHTGEFSGPR